MQIGSALPNFLEFSFGMFEGSGGLPRGLWLIPTCDAL
jgi:hypothetical protein